ncbi:hypothetical protein RUND412_005464 [Rhizina undulata]
MHLSTISILFPFLLSTPVSAIQTPTFLLPRTTQTCSDADSNPCNIPNTSFCCPSTTTCIPLENATSVICCTIDTLCDVIQPISCDSSTHTITCGSECCPLGFTCGPDEDRCIMNAENRPSTYPNATTTPSSLTTNPLDVSNSTTSPISEQCRAFLSTPSCPEFPMKAILTGLFPGIILGGISTFFLIKALELKTRRRTIHFNDRLSATISPTSPTIAVGASMNAPSYREYKPSPSEWSASPPLVVGAGETWRSGLRRTRDYSPNMRPTVGLVRRERVEESLTVPRGRPQSSAVSCISDGVEWERERGEVPPLRIVRDEGTHDGSF